MSKLTIIHRDRKKTFQRATAERHTFLLHRFKVKFIELEGLHFNLDSAVLLPVEPEDTAAERAKVTPSQVLAVCLSHADEFRQERLIITGHADTSGDPVHNVKLSELRAACVVALLVGGDEGKTSFIRIAKAQHKVEDYQRILEFVANTEGFDCDPKGVDGVHGPDTTAAIKNFQQAFNDAGIGAKLRVTGSITDETWGAFFEMYQRDLRRTLDEDPDDAAALDELRSHLTFFDSSKRSVGCGENFPIENRGVDGFRSAENRRCELCFLEPGNDPDLSGDHPGPGRCNPALCELNDPDIFVPTIIPVEPGKLKKIEVHLQLFYKDPQTSNPDHPFPEGLPVTVQFGDGSKEDAKLGPNGKLDLTVHRSKRTVILVFHYDQPHYIGSAGPKTPADQPKEKFAKKDDLGTLIVPGFRTFMLAPDMDLKNADWLGKPPTDASSGAIQIGDTSIGTAGAPVKLTLDPNWQYLKFLYFDRKLKQKLSIPAVMIEGLEKDSKTPLSQSNWLTDPSACQALPWMLRRDSGGNALNKPDEKVTLCFHSTPHTFIDSSAGSVAGRKVVTKDVDFLGSKHDPLFTEGEAVDRNFDEPSVERLAFYDLPEEWQSNGYFCKVGGSASTPPAKADFFEKVAKEKTTEDAPLIFSLDDLVLCDDTGGSLAITSWAPGTDRLAIFWHGFASGPANVSLIGIYRPDTNNASQKQSYLSEQVASLTTTNYIADYPDWTRLVIAKGNIYDAFDRRVPLAAGTAVGSRAATRYLDSPPIGAPGSQPAQQTATVRPFCTVHPFYNQAHHAWWTGNPASDRKTGRFDLVLLRCCGIEADGTTESALAMSYVRFSFNFNPPANPKPRNPAIGPDNPPEFLDSGPVLPVPLALVGKDRFDWVDLALQNIPLRWTGPDGTHNPTTATIVSRTPGGKNALSAKCLMFGQEVPRAMAHFELGVFRYPAPSTRTVRAYMASDRGYGTLDQGNNQSTNFFTAAHETGHGVSLGDEYIEQVHTPPNPPGGAQYPVPWVLGFDSNQPGGPYQQDEVNTAVPGQAGIMNGNDQVRGRYFWHIAEWMRVNLGTPFDVKHNNLTYTLPPIGQSNIAFTSPTADRFTLVNWPLRQTYGVTRAGSPHAQHDVFLYQLGHDAYADTRLPGAVRGVASPPPAAVAAYDGIMIAIVRLAFIFPAGTLNGDIHTWLQLIDASIRMAYCFRWKASGNAGTALSRVLLHFSARYFAPNYAPNPLTSSIAPHITVNVVSAGAPGWTGGTSFQTNRTSAGAAALVNAFADMIGLTGAPNTDSSYATLAGEVLGGAAVSAASS